MRPTPEAKPAERLEIGVLYGFRALMVLFVVNYHIWQQSWLPQYARLLGTVVDFDFFTRSGYLFVDGMMLLSGFLLYLPYARRKVEGTPVLGVKRFYLNRLIRIVPSYLFAVLAALLFFALPQGRYASSAAMGKDLLSHLTFTFTFFRETYLFTPLNGALWTVAVEMQFYLIFPLLARAAQKRPAATLSVMALLGWGYRALVYFTAADTAMLVNQMPAFLDVYALGMLGAAAYCRFGRAMERMDGRRRMLVEIASLMAFAGSVMVLLSLFRMQSAASAGGHEAIRLSQLRIRLPLALTLLTCMLAAAHMPRALQWLLGNRLMRFLSAISFNLYIWHQFLAVEMARSWFSDTLHSDTDLQRAYTLLCLSVAVVAAMLATFGLEQPVTKLANTTIKKLGRKNDHEGPPSAKAEPAVDPLLVRPEKGRTGVD